MNWFQNVHIEKANFEVSHADQLCVLGSCFSENMGSLLEKSGFKVAANPNGIVFNPVSLAFAMDELRSGFSASLVKRGTDWVSLDHHGSFFNNSKEALETRIAKERTVFLDALKKAKVLTITFGTAQVWRHLESNRVVANCHKLPSQDFKSEMLSVDHVVETWSKTIQGIKELNSNLKLVFTVSPVRYKRGGSHQNTISKSTLHLAIQELCNEFDHASYFPAYEICLDELRDYRFFADDFSHPTAQAVQHVYSKFQECFMTSDTIVKANKVAQLKRGLEHTYSSESDAQLAEKRIQLEVQKILA